MADIGDTVVYAAKTVRTLDPSAPIAQAIAVRHGKVIAVGTRAEVQKQAGRDARVVDLGEAVIVPGLQDAHAHLAGLGWALSVANLNDTRSVDEVVSRLKTAGPESYQGDWLMGRGWDQNDWTSGPGAGQFPTREALDAAFPDTPVYLSRVDGHAAWVNSEALRRARIGAWTKDPAGGRVVRDANGEPTGVLVDNAMNLVTEVIPELTDPQLEKRLTAALKKAAEVGLTGIHDAGMDLRTFEVLQQWDLKGALPLRVYAMADGQGKDAERFVGRGTFKGRMLTLRAVKFLMDGALGSRGAALHAPYSDDPGNSGLLLLTPEELEDRARQFIARGFQVGVHAIGDRANTLVLDVLERAMTEPSTVDEPNAGRHRLEHAQLLRAEELDRMKKLGVIASMQPTHATSDMPWAEARLGPERIQGAYAWRSVLEKEIPLAFGSDFPVEQPEPLLGLYSARTRQDPSGEPTAGWYPAQRLSGEEALRAFTTGAAYASFAEAERGELKPGMDADFVVLSVDPVDAPAKELLDAKVLMTVVAGRVVHHREEVKTALNSLY